MQSSKPIPKEQVEDFMSTTTQSYVDGKIVQTITDGDITHSPSSNIIFDTLASKLDISAYNDRFKGKYSTLSALQLAHTTSNDGDYAIVDAGSGIDALEYIWDTNEGWVKGNSTGATTTDALPEGSTNLYFQTARVLATILTGISFITGGAIVSTDTVLQAFGKIQKQINDLSNVFVPLTRTLTINGTTQNLSANRTFSIPSGGEKAIYSSYPSLGLTSLNTWRTWSRSSSMIGIDSNQLIGTGSSPTITGTTAYADTNYFLVKDCLTLSKMTFSVRENMSSNVTVELFLKSFDLVSGVGRGDETNGQLLIQEVINLGNLGNNFIKDNFTITPHTLNANTALYFFYRITSATGVNIQGVHLKLNFT